MLADRDAVGSVNMRASMEELGMNFGTGKKYTTQLEDLVRNLRVLTIHL